MDETKPNRSRGAGKPADEASVIRDAQRRLDARRAAWMREKAILDRRRSGDWAFAKRPPKRDEGDR